MPEHELLAALYKIDSRLAVLESHMETMTVNQIAISDEFRDHRIRCNERNNDITQRVSKVEVRSGLIASLIAAVGGAIGWFGGGR